jgi:hypothetical protein
MPCEAAEAPSQPKDRLGPARAGNYCYARRVARPARHGVRGSGKDRPDGDRADRHPGWSPGCRRRLRRPGAGRGRGVRAPRRPRARRLRGRAPEPGSPALRARPAQGVATARSGRPAPRPPPAGAPDRPERGRPAAAREVRRKPPGLPGRRFRRRQVGPCPRRPGACRGDLGPAARGPHRHGEPRLGRRRLRGAGRLLLAFPAHGGPGRPGRQPAAGRGGSAAPPRGMLPDPRQDAPRGPRPDRRLPAPAPRALPAAGQQELDRRGAADRHEPLLGHARAPRPRAAHPSAHDHPERQRRWPGEPAARRQPDRRAPRPAAGRVRPQGHRSARRPVVGRGAGRRARRRSSGTRRPAGTGFASASPRTSRLAAPCCRSS